MGGAMCVAVKYQGVETVMEVWTNQFAFFLHQPSFRDGGEMYRTYVGRAKRTNEWPKSILLDAITPSEYGAILVDLDCRQLLSIQGYTDPQRLSFQSVLAEEELSLLDVLTRLGHLFHFIDNRPIPEKPVRVLPGTRDSLADLLTGRMFYFEAYLHPAVFYVEHHNNMSKGMWEYAQAYAEIHGFKSPFEAVDWSTDDPSETKTPRPTSGKRRK